MGRMMRPTKKGLSPIWCATGSMVLTSTSLTTAVTAVTPARTTIGSQRVVLHQAASVASGRTVADRGTGVGSTARDDAWVGPRFTTTSFPTVGVEMGSLSMWDARTPKTE